MGLSSQTLRRSDLVTKWEDLTFVSSQRMIVLEGTPRALERRTERCCWAWHRQPVMGDKIMMTRPLAELSAKWQSRPQTLKVWRCSQHAHRMYSVWGHSRQGFTVSRAGSPRAIQ